MLAGVIWSNAAKRVPAVVLPQCCQSRCSLPSATGTTAGDAPCAVTTGRGWNADTAVPSRPTSSSVATP